jgi:hypothetical protein
VIGLENAALQVHFPSLSPVTKELKVKETFSKLNTMRELKFIDLKSVLHFKCILQAYHL